MRVAQEIGYLKQLKISFELEYWKTCLAHGSAKTKTHGTA